MTITIVCVCGHHNAVRYEDFECSYCARCLRRLLPEAVHAEAPAAPVTAGRA